MRIELTEVIWLEEQVLSFAELAELSDLPRELLEELVQSGAIVPIDDELGHEAHYGAAALAAARHARQLHEDFELDAAALVLVLGLCDRVSELEARLRELQAKLPRPLR
ncbi:MAG: chaperone modulator CbpM [Steroidobacteraceae bacterium]